MIFVQTSGSARVFPAGVGPSIQFTPAEFVTLRIQLLRPFMVDAANAGAVFDQVVQMTEMARRDWFAKLVGRQYIPAGQRVRLSRVGDGVYHGVTYEAASVTAFVSMAACDIDRFRRASGERGVLYNAPADDTVAKVLVSQDLDIGTVLERIREVKVKRPNDFLEFFGVIPSRRGFAVRVSPGQEDTFRELLNPEQQDVLGPAAGLRPTMYWLVKGLPSDITREAINRDFAETSQTWTGWPVVAINPGPRQGRWGDRGVCGWVVGSEVPPPDWFFQVGLMTATIEHYDKYNGTAGTRGGHFLPRTADINPTLSSAAGAFVAPPRDRWVNLVEEEDMEVEPRAGDEHDADLSGPPAAGQHPPHREGEREQQGEQRPGGAADDERQGTEASSDSASGRPPPMKQQRGASGAVPKCAAPRPSRRPLPTWPPLRDDTAGSSPVIQRILREQAELQSNLSQLKENQAGIEHATVMASNQVKEVGQLIGGLQNTVAQQGQTLIGLGAQLNAIMSHLGIGGQGNAAGAAPQVAPVLQEGLNPHGDNFFSQGAGALDGEQSW